MLSPLHLQWMRAGWGLPMTSNTGEHTGAGGPMWPRSSADLRNTQLCPACFAALSGPSCAACYLDLSSAHAVDLLQASTHAATHLERRTEIIARIRSESARRAVQAPVAAAPVPTTPAVAAPAVAASVVAAPAGAVAAVRTPTPGAPRPAPAGPARSGRSSVQMLLLIVGVSLVAVALVFFLIVAWFITGLVFRAVIVAAITLVMFAAVSLFKRFGLGSTAQGVAVLAVLLVYLDVWAVQATGLFGADAVDSAQYWAIALLASAPLLLAWFRVTGMRAGSVAGFAAVPIGAGLLTWALDAPFGQTTGGLAHAWLVSVVMIAASLIQLLAPSLGRRMTPRQPLTVERLLVLVSVAPAVPVAIGLGLFLAPAQVAVPLWSVGVPAVVFAAQVLLHGRRAGRLDRAVAVGFAVAAGLSAAAIPGAMGVRASTESNWVLWPVLAGIALVLVLEVLRTKTSDRDRWRILGGALIGAAGPTGAVLLFAAWFLVAAFVERSALARGFRAWLPGEAALPADYATAQAAVLLAGGAAMAVALWAATGLARQRAALAGALLVAAAMGAAVIVPWPAAASLAYLAIASGALCALTAPALRERSAGLPRLRTLALSTLAVNAVAGYLLAFDSLWLWLAASAIMIGLLLGSREIRSGFTLQRPLLLAAAVVFALGTTSVIPEAIMVADPAAWPGMVGMGAPLALASAALLLLFSLPLGRFAAPRDRVWALAAAAASFAAALATGPTDDPARAVPVLATVALLLAVAACVLLFGLRANRALRVTRRIALVVLTPLLWVGGMVALELLRSEGVRVDMEVYDWWPTILGALALAGSLAFALARPGSQDRVFVDSGSGVVLLTGVLTAASYLEAPSTWLALLISAVGVLLAAIDSSGLFNARTLRHQLGWAALVLATAALWLGLTDAGVSAPEPYTLPLAAALLAIAALLARFGAGAYSAGTAVAGTTAAGLLIALVPSAVAGAEGSLLRPILTVAVGGVILIGAVMWKAGLWTATPPSAALRLALIGTGGLAVVVATGARALSTLAGALGTVPAVFEFWVAVGAAVLVAAALANAGEPGRLSTGLVAVALVGAALLECAAIAASPEASGPAAVRAIAVVAVLGATHVLLAWLRSPTLAGWLTPLALALAALTAVVFLVRSATTGGDAVPFEWVSVPVAAAWIAGGALHLARTPEARSWPALGGGVALLLVPSLLADYVDSPLWRVVGLGVLTIAVLLVGLATRLQAPFVLGALVVLLHGLAQLWPWLSALYNPTLWWLWFGAGGVLLIAVAARYERRVANLRAAVSTVGALR